MASTRGRAVVVPLTNKSGGAVAAGDVVVIDTSNNEAFTTSTAGAVTGGVGIAQEAIANNATGRVLIAGYAALVNVNASVTRGNYGKTHTVAKQAVDAGASRVAGAFCQFLTGGTTPTARIFAPDLGAAAGDVAADAIWDAPGDLAVGSGADTASKLALGATDGMILERLGGALGWALPPVPTPVQHPSGNFTIGTTCAVTMTAPTVGNRLLAFVSAAGRGATSITQTNVTWTQLFTGNGNSLYNEIWVGVVSGSPGTTVTANFTGSNSNYLEVIELPSTYPAFSTAGTPNANTGASGTIYNVGPLVTAPGDYICWLIAAGQASSYSILNHPYLPLTPFGGFGRFGFLRSLGGEIALLSVNVASNAWRGTIVKIS